MNKEFKVPKTWQKGREDDFKKFKKLLKKLMRKNPDDRLVTAKDIKRQKFFRDVDFDKIYEQFYAPTYKPYIDGNIYRLVKRQGCSIGQTRKKNDRYANI